MRFGPLLAAVCPLACCSCDGCGHSDPLRETAAASAEIRSEAVSQGAGCRAEDPAGFPYRPGCCAGAVGVPEVNEAGFDDGKVGTDAKGRAQPDHVHASIAGPSDTSFAVNWRTDLATTATQLLYGTDAAALAAADGPSDKVKLVRGHHMLFGSPLDQGNLTRVHEAYVCGLSAGQAYRYKVGGPGRWSRPFSLATGPALGSTAPWRFAVLGDSRGDPPTFAKIEQAIASQAPDLQVFTGDAVALGAAQPLWNAWFEASTAGAGGFAAETALAQAPFMVVNGNHDNLSINFVAQFALPEEVEGLGSGRASRNEAWYSFDYGNAHFVALDDTPAEVAVGRQRDWLKADLAAVDRNKTPWLFAVHHRSLYSCGGEHRSAYELRAAWQPLFDAYKVDLVLSGHDHLYERSKPIRGLDGTDGIVARAGPNDAPIAGSGTVYVVSGGAGAPLYPAASVPCAHTHYTESSRNYVLIDVAGNKLHLKAVRLDGSVLDELEVSK